MEVTGDHVEVKGGHGRSIEREREQERKDAGSSHGIIWRERERRRTVGRKTLKSYAAARPILMSCLRCHPADEGSDWKEATTPRAEATAKEGRELGAATGVEVPSTSRPRARLTDMARS